MISHWWLLCDVYLINPFRLHVCSKINWGFVCLCTSTVIISFDFIFYMFVDVSSRPSILDYFDNCWLLNDTNIENINTKIECTCTQNCVLFRISQNMQHFYLVRLIYTFYFDKFFFQHCLNSVSTGRKSSKVQLKLQFRNELLLHGHRTVYTRHHEKRGLCQQLDCRYNELDLKSITDIEYFV